jgi:uncharacterized protein
MSPESCPLSKLEKLLVATDRSVFSEGAVREGIAFAEKCSSGLVVMTVIETAPEYETIGAGAYQKEEDEAKAYLDEVKARALDAGVSSCETVLRRDRDPYRAIIHEASDKKADMIVVGRRGRSGLMKTLMGKVAEKVIGNSPCKVLVVPKAARVECGRVLAATDGSAHSLAAAAEAIEIAKRSGGSVIAVSAVRSEQDAAEAKKDADNVAALGEKEGVPVEVLTLPGRPHEVIVETAGGRAVDLIVMGAYGKTGLKKLLMGSSTEKVVGSSRCAVLVVRAW